MKRAVLIVAVSLFVLLILLPGAASRTSFGALLTWLPFGWLVFLKRNIPQISTNWSLIGMVLICSAILIFLGNWFLSAVSRQLQINRNASQSLSWHFRWTLCLYAGIWLLFAIVFGASGLFRQTTWLVNEKLPWYEERLNFHIELRSADLTVHEVLAENESKLEKTRMALLREKTYRRKLFIEQFEVLFYANAEEKVEAYVIIPRNSNLRSNSKFGLSIPDQGDLIHPISDLRRTIAQLDAKYPKK